MKGYHICQFSQLADRATTAGVAADKAASNKEAKYTAGNS